MPTVPVLDAKGKAQEQLELSADVFGGAVRVPLLHQTVVKELAARRAGTHDKKMPTEMRRSALRDALAAKIASGEVVVVDRLGVAEAKTKLLTSRLKELGLPAEPTLIVVSERTQGLTRAARN